MYAYLVTSLLVECYLLDKDMLYMHLHYCKQCN